MREIVRYELLYWLKRPGTYIFAGALFTAAIFNAAQGDGQVDHVFKNAPLQVFAFLELFSVLAGTFIIAIIFSGSFFRDIAHNVHPFIYSYPVTKFNFLTARFLGAALVTGGVFAGLGFGHIAGLTVHVLQGHALAPFRLSPYLLTYLVVLLPNLLWLGAVLFSVIVLSRNMIAVYAGTAVLLLFYLVVRETLLPLIPHDTLAALLDPFGETAINRATQYWMIAQKNTMSLPLPGTLLLNRGLWLLVGALSMTVAYVRFDFNTNTTASVKAKTEEIPPHAQRATTVALPAVYSSFGFGTDLRHLFALTRIKLNAVIRNSFFISLAVAGLIFFFVVGRLSNHDEFGSAMLYTTRGLVDLLPQAGRYFIYAVLIFFSGELIWQERSLRFAPLLDSFPVRSWVCTAANFLATTAIATVFVAEMFAAAFLVQTASGYYAYEWLLYLKQLTGVTLVDYALFAALCVFIHTLVHQKYLGFFANVLFWLVLKGIWDLGFQHPLYHYKYMPPTGYSDIAGYGPHGPGIVAFTLYWTVVAVALLGMACIVWQRGLDEGWIKRLRTASARLLERRFAPAVLIALWLVTGGYLFYHLHVLAKDQSPEAVNPLKAAYEKKYKRFEDIAQPSIHDVRLNVDIFPEERQVTIRGRYVLLNKTDRNIDSLHVILTRDATLVASSIDGRAQAPDLADHGYYIYRLAETLAPGETLAFDFHIERMSKGILDAGNPVISNGTVFTSGDVLPVVAGYFQGYELEDDAERARYQLPPRVVTLPDIDVNKQPENPRDAHFSFEATLSTSSGQVALTQGRLVNQWEKEGRLYYQYKMDTPSSTLYPFVSGAYDVYRETWRPPGASSDSVIIEIYYHKGHAASIGTLAGVMRTTLRTYTEHFGPYQHPVLRLVEVPGNQRMARAFQTTITASEATGFTFDFDARPDRLHLPFYIIAHEIAHQWFGSQQVVGDRVKGRAFLSETMAQYGAMRAVQDAFGRESMRQVLRFELERYLEGRSRYVSEQPLAAVEDQSHVYYHKGALVMFTLQELLGEATLEHATRTFINQVKDHYTHTREFLAVLRSVTPDSSWRLVEEMFLKTVVYDLAVTEAVSHASTPNTFELVLNIAAERTEFDGGRTREQHMLEWVDIDVYGAAHDEPIYSRKHAVRSGANRIVLSVHEKPARVAVNPFFSFIDHMPANNVRAVFHE